MKRAPARPMTAWTDIVLGLLTSPQGERRALIDTCLAAAIDVTGGRDAALVDWLGGYPVVVGLRGVAPEALTSRSPAGCGVVAGRPVVISVVDAHTDLWVLDAAGAEPFDDACYTALAAVAALLRHADMSHPQERAAELYRLAPEILRSLDLDSVLLSVVNAAARLLRAEVAGILEGDADELRMRCVTGHRSVGTARLRVRPGQGIAGKVMETRVPHRVDDYANDPTITKEFLPIALEEGTQSGLCVPMKDTSGDLIGVLCVWRLRRSVFLDEDEDVLVTLANLASIAVVNARLYELQKRTTTELKEAHTELARRLRAADQALGLHRALVEIAAQGSDMAPLLDAFGDLTEGTVALLRTDRSEPTVVPAGEPIPALDLLRSGTRHSEGRHSSTISLPDGSRWILARVEAAGTEYGHLLAQAGKAPETRTQATTELTAAVCALLIAQEQAMAAATSHLRAELLWDVLEGRVTEDAEVLTRAAHLDLGLDVPARLLLIRAQGLPEAGGDDELTAKQIEWARATLGKRLAHGVAGVVHRSPVVVHRGDDFVVVVPGRTTPQEIHEAAQAAVSVRPFGQLRMFAGASRVAEELAHLPDAFRQADAARRAAAVGPKGVVLFEELGVLQFLLAPGHRQDLNEFAAAVVGRVDDYDRQRGTDLVATLEALLDSNCQLAVAAKSLHVHPKTVRYRLDRIQDLTGLDLNVREDRLNAELALRILRLRDRHPG